MGDVSPETGCPLTCETGAQRFEGDRSGNNLTGRGCGSAWDRYAHILASLPEGVLFQNVEGQVEFCNQSAEQILGLTADQIVGRSPGDFLQRSIQENRDPFPDESHPVTITLRTGQPISNVVMGFSSPDADLTWVSVSSRLVTRPDGSRDGVVTTFTDQKRPEHGTTNGEEKSRRLFNPSLTDLSSRQGAEQKPRDSEDLFRRLFDQAPRGIAVSGLDRRFIQVNAALCRMLGYTEEELLGKTWVELTHPEDLEKSVDLLARMQDSPEELIEAEKRYLRNDGQVVWVCMRASLVRDSNGSPVHVVAHIEDITERKRVEARLVEASERLTLAVRAGGVGIWEYDVVNDRLVWDEQMLRLYGIKPDQFLGAYAAWTTALHPDDLKRGHEEIQQALRGEQDFNTEFRVYWPDGSIHHIRGLALVQRDKSGNPVKMIGTNWDITDQKEAAAQLQESNRQLLEATQRANELALQAGAANAAKSEFLANMSHEIRTPMNGVIGMTRLLLDTELNEEQKRYADRVRTSGEILLGLINDILDFSKIEAKKLDLEMLDFDLLTLLDDFAAAMALRAHEKGLELICAPDLKVPVSLRGDSGRVRQILTNLVGNAIKFTADGEVVVRVSVMEETQTEALLRFTVQDTGIGIPAAKIEGLFTKFTQADASTTRRYGGTGLGLAISRQLAELMGGECNATSQHGKGSEFWFTARLGKQTEASAQSATSSVLQNIRVLIADGNATARQMLASRVTSWGMRSFEAQDGFAALRSLYRALEAHDPFHVALIDRELSGIDGETLCRAIQSDQRLRNTKVVMLTRLASLRVGGCSDHFDLARQLTKPVAVRELNAVLLEALCAIPHRKEPVIAGSRSGQNLPSLRDRKGRILVAEDNITNQEVALGILKRMGLRADAVANGIEAIRALEALPYDLVLMDVQMPEMDGLEATRHIRNPKSHVLNHEIPIIAMTAHAMRSDRERCLQSGMNGYLTKPVAVPALRGALEKWLRSGGHADSCSRENDDSHRPEEREAMVFDRSSLLERLMGDDGLARKVMSTFLADIPHRIEELKEQLETGNAPGSQMCAHAIKGAAANVGGERLRQTALAIENTAKARNLNDALRQLPELEAQFALLSQAIKQSEQFPQ